MRWKPKVLIGSLTAAAVLLVAVVDLGRTSPGPLSAVHQREPDLAGRRDCSECHGGWRRTMAEACLDCHAVVASQILHGEGLHGAQGREAALLCARCHSEHHGTGFAIVNRQSFARAGVPRIEDFDHGLVGFEMDGKHLELDCRRCHPNANDAILGRGETRFVGLARDCASCHQDAHEGRLVLACAACHGQQEWKRLHSVGHEQHLALVGGHGDVDCRVCHSEQGQHALEVLGGVSARPAPRACTDCHESPHAERFVAGAARQLSLAVEASCVACHEAEHESFRDEALVLEPTRHAASGFRLDGPHEELACADCHDPQLEAFGARYPGRGPDDCASCHEDPHGGQFAEGPFALQGCVGCHDRERFDPHAFTPHEHERASLPLTGAHLGLECQDCHELPAPDAPRVFRGTPADCEACHPDAHAGFFLERAPELALQAHGSCAACHLTTRFDELPPGGFDHARFTGFEVAGAHAQASCEVCHPLGVEPDERGRRFGRVHERFGPFEGCVSCHPDPHEGRFERPDLPDEVEGRRDCARCHLDASFRAFPQGFEHGRWTGFALLGRHAEIECAACHAPRIEADAVGRTWERARGTACADCHVDVHRGQFARAGKTDCARCHASSSRFQLLAFDHDRDARFSLGDAHAALACAACHLQEGDTQAAAFVRYRPLPTGCADCHGIHDEPLLRRRRGG